MRASMRVLSGLITMQPTWPAISGAMLLGPLWCQFRAEKSESGLFKPFSQVFLAGHSERPTPPSRSRGDPAPGGVHAMNGVIGEAKVASSSPCTWRWCSRHTGRRFASSLFVTSVVEVVDLKRPMNLAPLAVTVDEGAPMGVCGQHSVPDLRPCPALQSPAALLLLVFLRAFGTAGPTANGSRLDAAMTSPAEEARHQPATAILATGSSHTEH